MKAGVWAAVLIAVCVAGCNKAPDEIRVRHGRYAGIGVYSPGVLWAKMVRTGQPADPVKARTSDDEHVIVVVDSDTGEIRQCGDLSGYCVGMNPWTRTLLQSQTLPASLTAHAAEPAQAPTPQR